MGPRLRGTTDNGSVRATAIRLWLCTTDFNLRGDGPGERGPALRLRLIERREGFSVQGLGIDRFALKACLHVWRMQRFDDFGIQPSYDLARQIGRTRQGKPS